MTEQYLMWLHELTVKVSRQGYVIPVSLSEIIIKMYDRNLTPDMADIELRVIYQDELLKRKTPKDRNQ